MFLIDEFPNNKLAALLTFGQALQAFVAVEVIVGWSLEFVELLVAALALLLERLGWIGLDWFGLGWIGLVYLVIIVLPHKGF